MDDIEANQAYGALTEGLYVASFTFERAMARSLELLKSGGWRQVGAGFDDVNAFVRSLGLHQFKALADQRKEFAERVKELQPEVSNRAIAEALGVSHDTVNRDAGRNCPASTGNAQENRELGGRNCPGAADGKRDAAIINNRDTREERREEKLEEIARGNRELPGGVRYPVIDADPPWRYEHPPMGGNRVVENHYPTMTLEDICALRVDKLAADDAVLYLWATAPMAMKAGQVIEAWGFDYRINIVWVKDKIGMGYYARVQHELLLVARRGKLPPPRELDRLSSVVHADRTEHSVKPEIFHELIERWYPSLPKIELFRRGPARPGWAAWGNQLDAPSPAELEAETPS